MKNLYSDFSRKIHVSFKKIRGLYILPCLLAGVVVSCLASGCSKQEETDAEVWRLLQACDTYYNNSDTTDRWKAALDKLALLLDGSRDNRALGEYYYQKSCYAVSCTPGDSVEANLRKAREYYLRTDDKKETGKVFLVSTQYANAMQQHDLALRYVKEALSLVTDYDSLRGELLAEEVAAYVMSGAMQSAINRKDEVLPLLKKAKDTLAYLIVSGNLGVAYRRLEMNDSAMACYNEALQLALPFGDHSTTAYLYNNLSVLYCENKRFEEALDFAGRAEEYGTKAGDDVERLSAVANKAAALVGMAREAEAVSMLKKAYPAVRETGHAPMLLKYVCYIIDYSLKIGQEDSVDFYYREGKAIAEQLSENATGVIGLRVSEINYLMFKHDYRTALQYLEALPADAANRAMPEYKRLSEMAECHMRMGNFEKAYALLSRSAALADSVRNDAAEKQMSEFTVRYQTKERELEILRLKEEKATHDAMVARLVGILVALILVLAIVIVLLLYHRKVTLQKKEIVRAQNYIAGMESERARFARELHDGACNDLLAIGMELGAKDMEPTVVASRVRELRTSLRRISHELMPPSFRLAALNEILEDYLSHLTLPSGLEMSFRCEGEGWQDVRSEVAYELYRIVQEAVGNVVKHANATRAEVRLQKSEGKLVLDVSDNGRVVQKEKAGGIGMRTINERVMSIGGDWSFDAGAEGAQLHVEVSDFLEKGDR